LGYNYYKEVQEFKKFQEFKEESGAEIQEQGGISTNSLERASLARPTSRA
jgi:hypothetical protein